MSVMDPFLTTPIAHRTLHDLSRGKPENSWEGLEAALDLGLAIEIDVQMSSDGVAMVFHDYDLDRLTAKTGWISDFTADQLGKIPLKYGTKTIPRLDEFMTRIAGRIPVLIELKDQDGALGDKETALEQGVCKILNGYDGATALMSFNPNMMMRCMDYAPKIPRGLVTDPFTALDWPEVDEQRRDVLRQIPDFDKVDASFVSHNQGDLNSDALARIKAKDALIFCWTIRSKDQEKAARKIVDNITFEGYVPDWSA